MQKFSFEELYGAYLDCIKNKKSSKDILFSLVNNTDPFSRKSYFEKLEKFLERLVIYINITNDLKLFGNPKKYLNYLEILIKVKKMVKCWNR